MNKTLRLITVLALTILPATAFAQVDAHHPDAATGTPAPAATPAPAPAPAAPADQSANMMQMMQMMGQMMPMMKEMMQMMQGGMMGMPGGPGGMPMAGMSDAAKAYMGAMAGMNGPMMQAMQIADPDVAFVKGMVAHHEGAIDMAKAVLQYGKDESVKKWANQIIEAQQAEKTEMEAWLKQHGQ